MKRATLTLPLILVLASCAEGVSNNNPPVPGSRKPAVNLDGGVAAVPPACDVAFPYNDCRTTYPHGAAFLSTDNKTLLKLWSSYRSTFIVDCNGNACDSGDTACRVEWDNPAETVSEGMGYGMLLAAYLNDRIVFDRLWRFAQLNLDQGSACVGTCSGLMHWKVSGCGAVTGHNAATDADEDMILALYMAHRVWGGSAYLDAARQQAVRLRTHCIEQDGWIRNGDEWGGCSANNMNPSYFAPGWYRVFDSFDPHPRWARAIDRSYHLLVERQIDAHGYALPSNWCDCNGAVGGGGSGTPPGEYGYEAARATWRASADLAWSGSPMAARDIEKRQLPFWRAPVGPGNDFGQIKGPYDAASGAAGHAQDACFVGMAATAFIHDTDAARRTAAWNGLTQALKSAIQGHQYYCSSLGMLAALFVTGNMPAPTSLP